MTYAGHMPDGSSVQRHSAGGLYPIVLFAKETTCGRLWGVITPKRQDGYLVGSYDDTVAYAEGLLQIKQGARS